MLHGDVGDGFDTSSSPANEHAHPSFSGHRGTSLVMALSLNSSMSSTVASITPGGRSDRRRRMFGDAWKGCSWRVAKWISNAAPASGGAAMVWSLPKCSTLGRFG